MKYPRAVAIVIGLAAVAAARINPKPTDQDAASNAIVCLDDSSIIGRSSSGVESFNAIPFADPPVGALRLRPPRKFSGKLGAFNATGRAPSCPQFFFTQSDTAGGGGNSTTASGGLDMGQEDCLTVNVQRPQGTQPCAKLPVLFWIYGGGFQLGSTNTYDATSLLSAAVAQGQPFIFVAVNYRVGGFGFLAGKEILRDGSANLGLLDQRMGLRWVADNIAAFGGDPEKVTIWGESAGSMSVFDHMMLYGGDATYKGKPLFRGAMMNSGSAFAADPVDCPKAQAIYDAVAKNAGCLGASDTLDCLRNVPYQRFLDAVNSVPSILSYNSLANSYLPRPDGHVLTDSPDVLQAAGRYYAVPMIIGDQEDEGTLFSLSQKNLTTTHDVVNYLSELYFQGATKDQLTELVSTYSLDPSDGSPFRTGLLNERYPGFKRLAAILGDFSFTLTRRVVLAVASRVKPDTPTWSYLASYFHGSPSPLDGTRASALLSMLGISNFSELLGELGTSHASDILQMFYGIPDDYATKSCRSYYFNFLYNLDPNKGVKGYANWPEWNHSRELMWFKTVSSNAILKDDFRAESYNWLLANGKVLRA